MILSPLHSFCLPWPFLDGGMILPCLPVSPMVQNWRQKLSRLAAVNLPLLCGVDAAAAAAAFFRLDSQPLTGFSFDFRLWASRICIP